MVKQRIFAAVLGLLVLWPPVHYALSRRYHIDHWRFSGFAMYARPSDVPYLIFSVSPRDIQAALGADSARIDDFVARRRLWGELAAPDDIGRLILERMPSLSELTITIATAGLQPGDDYISYRMRRYRYTRP